MQALRIVAPRTAVPIHYDDDTVFKSPLEDLRAAVAGAGLETAIHYVARGGTLRFGPATS